MLCIYHIADHDGKGSAAIVKSIYPEIEFLGLNHDMDVPYEMINQHNKIIVCDYCLPMDYMFELNASKDLIWIDHHISAIKEYEEKVKQGLPEIKGLRRDGTAAIVLTWEYFYKDKPIPQGIKLLGLSDVYDLSDERVRPFEYAMQAAGVNRPTDEIWTSLINDTMNIKEMVAKGEAILSYIKVRNYRLVRGISFTSEYKGHKCICANMPQGKSEFFDSLDILDRFDFMVNFFMNKHNCWNLSFYSYKNFDVSKIAAEFGGGGHFHAAGASGLKELPEFLKIHLQKN
ncbi:MAG: hypothetical protein IJ545_01365 [Alphaproteobacteria bacterium]|nr:hypothetical protein [Alphaproteobacteria bacterium]